MGRDVGEAVRDLREDNRARSSEGRPDNTQDAAGRLGVVKNLPAKVRADGYIRCRRELEAGTQSATARRHHMDGDIRDAGQITVIGAEAENVISNRVKAGIGHAVNCSEVNVAGAADGAPGSVECSGRKTIVSCDPVKSGGITYGYRLICSRRNHRRLVWNRTDEHSDISAGAKNRITSRELQGIDSRLAEGGHRADVVVGGE